MNKLEQNFTDLLNFAKENNFSEPFSQVYFVEEKSIRFIVETGLRKIPRQFLFISENYKDRFDKLFDLGHSWINMYLAGVLENSLIVIIELPDYENSVPRKSVLTKFSLPEKRIAENNWQLEPFYQIID